MLDLLKQLVEPPASLFALALVGLVAGRRFRRAGRALVVLAMLALYLLSTPLVGHALLRALEAKTAEAQPAAAAPLAGEAPGAIVILSAGVAAADFAGTDAIVDALTLGRLRRGAALHRETGLPILLSGGPARGGTLTLAAVMAQSLRDDFGVAPAWLETRSSTTAENAIHSAAILRRAGIGRVYLVTQAWHLPRASQAFRRQGIGVVPAAAAYNFPAGPFGLSRLVPSASGLLRSRYALHEYIGRVWLALGGTA